MRGAIRVVVSGASDVGRTRSTNEDGWMTLQVRRSDGADTTVLGVADGVSGAQGGDRASRWALQTVGEMAVDWIETGWVRDLRHMSTTLTTDHTAAADLVTDGRSLALLDGDVVLLCTDGLHHLVSDDEIREVLVAGRSSGLAVLANDLIARANAQGGTDNVTVVLAACLPS